MLLSNDRLVNAVSSNAFGGIPFTVDGSTSVLSADRPANVVPMSVLVTPSLSMTDIYVKSDNKLLSPKMTSNADSPGNVSALSLVHPAKALTSIWSAFGMLILAILSFPLNALESTLSIFD
jgi:hypothetical protein